jgi:outer membrane protein assembly factor BamE (lipoprotein component of BamABCDE complex)
MKYLKNTITVLLITLLTGCAAGVNFAKMTEDQLVLGKTTKQDVLTSMGEPNGKGTNTFNGIELEILSYSYAIVGGKPALPDVTPARSQGLVFRDSVLVGKEYTSSFASDSTLFDIDKAKSIAKGQTKEDVIAIMGSPLGGYLYPVIDNENEHAYVYMFVQTIGFTFQSDIFVVEFNESDIVTKTKLSSTGQL